MLVEFLGQRVTLAGHTASQGRNMSTATRPVSHVVRFDCYEADLDSGELRKRGIRVPLREQSFQVLASLLQRPGEVVTREELRHRLWNNQVFVDFDNNLNSVVAHLRERLCDSADRPRFIETLPKRGYRFIAEVVEVELERPPAASSVAFVRPRPKRWIRLALGLVALLATLVALNVGGLRTRLRGRAGPPRIGSLAVMPLTNLSRDPEQEYFADGMTEMLITELSKISSLKVISRISVMHYKKTDKTVPQIAHELDVDGVLEGSVMREGDQVRVSVQLIHGPTDKHLWAETYQRELRGVLALQSEVAQAVAQEVRASLTPEEHVRLAHARLVNPQAYDAYLKGRHFWETRTPEGLQKALEYFEFAVRIDPGCALAYTGLADTYSILGDQKLLAPGESFPKARAAAERALELDENLAEAHAAMALVLHAYYWDWPGSEREINRAIQLNPGYASAHHWHALFLSQMGQHTEALAEIRKAQALDPLSPRINANIGGSVLSAARQYEQAIQELQKALELFPEDATTLVFLGAAFSAAGRHEEAIAYTRRGITLGHEPAESEMLNLARVLALAGKREEANQIIATVLKPGQKKHVLCPAELYVALGDRDQAFACLEMGYKERDSDMAWLLVAPGLDPLRSDPRFAALLRKMHLAS